MMPDHTIRNFTDRDALSVTSSTQQATGLLVTLYQFAGSMSIHFSMRPEQARQMAETLIAHADELESKHEDAPKT